MIILYIPFKEKNDLLPLAHKMANHMAPSIPLIIQHSSSQENNQIETSTDQIPENEELEIYILGHGISPFIDRGEICSDINKDTNTTKLPIETIAKRFNIDFLYFYNQIKRINLYFCNQANTEKTIAETFHQHLLNPEQIIHYFKGNLSTIRTAILIDDKEVSINETRRLVQIKPIENIDKERLTLKKQDLMLFQSWSQGIRFGRLTEKKRQKRQDIISSMRKSA